MENELARVKEAMTRWDERQKTLQESGGSSDPEHVLMFAAISAMWDAMGALIRQMDTKLDPIMENMHDLTLLVTALFRFLKWTMVAVGFAISTAVGVGTFLAIIGAI